MAAASCIAQAVGRIDLARPPDLGRVGGGMDIPPHRQRPSDCGSPGGVRRSHQPSDRILAHVPGVYICGPGPMLDAARTTATAAGWPDPAVHFEYFKNTIDVDLSSSFTVELARSALTIDVPAGTSVLDVLRINGVALPSSCEQGACGTCLVTVLAGEPDHQDVYLNETERRAGDRMLTCVSRSHSERLVLDI